MKTKNNSSLHLLFLDLFDFIFFILFLQVITIYILGFSYLLYNEHMIKKALITSISLFLLLFSSFITPIQAVEPYPELNSAFMYMVDIETNQVLASIRSDEQIYPASMTKIMTAILAIENLHDYDERLLIDEEALAPYYEINASVAGYALYDDPSVLDCLYGTLLPSGAECADALALKVSGSYEAFVDLMNSKAKELGMDHTHFMNPTGLHQEEHVSTCEDIAKLLSYSAKNDLFMKIVSTKEYVATPVYSSPQGLLMKSHVLLDYDGTDGLQGGKSGFTPDAGRCLASIGEVNGMKVVLVTAFSGFMEGPLLDVSSMYEWAKNNYEKKLVVDETKPLKTIVIEETKDEEEITIYPSSSLTLDCMKDGYIKEDIHLPDTLLAPLEEGTNLGSYRVYVDNEVVYEETFTLDHFIQQNNIAMIRDFMKTKPHLVLFYAGTIVLLFTFIRSFIHSHSK